MNRHPLFCLAPMRLVACAGTPSLAVPSQRDPGHEHTLDMIVAATGVQVYE